MKLSVKCFALTTAILWSMVIFMSGMASIIWPSYGIEFPRVVSSIYPGFNIDADIDSVMIGTLYGMVDGGIGGTVSAWGSHLFVD